MRQSHFMALRTGDQIQRLQSILSAPSVSSSTGNPLLGYSGHCLLSFHLNRTVSRKAPAFVYEELPDQAKAHPRFGCHHSPPSL
jgi:hypothetical protein